MYECFGISEETGEALDNMLCKLFAPLLGVTPESLSDKKLFGQDNESDGDELMNELDKLLSEDKNDTEPQSAAYDDEEDEIRIEETGCRSLMSRVIISK